MPTPMRVYKEIAERYGVNAASRSALSQFFNHDIAKLPESEQREIAEELYAREGESREVEHRGLLSQILYSSRAILSRLTHSS